MHLTEAGSAVDSLTEILESFKLTAQTQGKQLEALAHTNQLLLAQLEEAKRASLATRSLIDAETRKEAASGSRRTRDSDEDDPSRRRRGMESSFSSLQSSASSINSIPRYCGAVDDDDLFDDGEASPQYRGGVGEESSIISILASADAPPDEFDYADVDPGSVTFRSTNCEPTLSYRSLAAEPAVSVSLDDGRQQLNLTRLKEVVAALAGLAKLGDANDALISEQLGRLAECGLVTAC